MLADYVKAVRVRVVLMILWLAVLISGRIFLLSFLRQFYILYGPSHILDISTGRHNGNGK